MRKKYVKVVVCIVNWSEDDMIRTSGEDQEVSWSTYAEWWTEE